MSSTPSTSSTPPKTQVKKENEEEIKDFAEAAMNEFLGWYGYERLELRRWAASRAKDGSSPDQPNEQKDKDECSWCNKNITSETRPLQQAGATFCSEVCFSQSRRANFKRAKTCDWCRHVRHTVAYVDFQDGATQLQFCSDKCLNQYKMHIFCRETQAHLDLNPHLVNAASSSNLITPELWLRNCKSRSTSPNSEKSGSPKPETVTHNKEKRHRIEVNKESNVKEKSPLPLITVAPPSKLLKLKRLSEEHQQKSPESKKDTKPSKVNLRKRQTSRCSATITSQTAKRANTPKAQDLSIRSPNRDEPSLNHGNTDLLSPSHSLNPHHIPPFSNALFGMPRSMFMDIPRGPLNDQRLPNIFPNQSFRAMPMPQDVPRYHLPLNVPPTIGQPPPVTVLVPYPVILPIPLPIPVPLPMSAFVQAHFSNTKIKVENRSEENEGPLDFTMNGDKKNQDGSSSPTLDDNEVMEDLHNNNERIAETENPTETESPEQTLPKFKITRLNNRYGKIVKTREQPESTRPLRKRRRLVEVPSDDDSLIPKSRKIVEV